MLTPADSNKTDRSTALGCAHLPQLLLRIVVLGSSVNVVLAGRYGGIVVM